MRIMVLICLISIGSLARQSAYAQEVDVIAAVRSGCCKVCTTSQACGDSCISKSFSCSKPSGCACNGGASGGGGGGKDDNKNDDKKTPTKVSCPKVIANKTTGTYAMKSGFECYTKASAAEGKGYISE